MTATEAERRRAAGERTFVASLDALCVGASLLRNMPGPVFGPYGRDCVAALLRALVLQELLVTFSPPWNEEVSR